MDESTLEDCFPYYFPNEILLEIFRHVAPKDILQLRLVCKEWADLTALPEIKNRFCVRLDRQRTPANFLEHIQKYGTKYISTENLILNKTSSNNSLVTLLIKLSRTLRYLKAFDTDLIHNLGNTGLINLEELTLEWEESLPYEVLDLSKLKNLKALDMKCNREGTDWSWKIFEQLASPSNTLRLKKFHFAYSSEFNSEVLTILNNFKSTLKDLGIRCHESIKSNDIRWHNTLKEIKHLKAIELSGFCDLNMAMLIFNNLPEEAPLRNVNLDGVLESNNELIALLAKKWRTKIKKLRIVFSNHISKDSAAEIWKLRDNLEDFEVSFCKQLNLSDLVPAIALEKNYKLRRLSARSLQTMDDESMCLLAQNLPLLEVLEVPDCPSSVTNRSLAHIFRYQTKLHTLLIDGCKNVEDSAFEGICEPTWSESYSCSRLVNLEILDLSNCTNLSANFGNHFKFPCLRILKLNNCKNITTKALCKITDNCPVIETLEIYACQKLKDKALYSIFRNLKRLTFLDFRECNGISPKAINENVTTPHQIQTLLFTDPLSRVKESLKRAKHGRAHNSGTLSL